MKPGAALIIHPVDSLLYQGKKKRGGKSLSPMMLCLGAPEPPPLQKKKNLLYFVKFIFCRCFGSSLLFPTRRLSPSLTSFMLHNLFLKRNHIRAVSPSDLPVIDSLSCASAPRCALAAFRSELNFRAAFSLSYYM